MPPTLSTTSSSSASVLDGIEQLFQLNDAKLLAITKTFVDEFGQGLGEYNKAMAMIPTFVTGVPDGSEKGTFLALDLGGTNLRVCEVTLHGNHEFTLRQQKYKVSEELKTGEASRLFDYLADSVDAFLTEMGHEVTNEEDLYLGLTFSFPVEQTALDRGILLTWTKGFAAKNAIGHDVVKMLQDSFDRKHLHVRCCALVNDTVGALLSRAYTSGGCFLGAIFGTGTNGAYVENISKITKLASGSAPPGRSKMVVNTEWGAFNNSRTVLPSTPFDNKLDRESINPRFQAYEKLISGMYLGEITRNLMLNLIDASPPILFKGKSTPILNTHYGFDTAYMSAIEEAKTFDDVRQVFVSNLAFASEDVSDDDARIVQWAVRLVATRAAKLSGCAVATVLIQTGLAKLGGGGGRVAERFSVGVDGSLIQFYPNFERALRESLRTIVGKDVEEKVDIGLAKDGSGVGAALCALEAIKLQRSIEGSLHGMKLGV